MYHSLLIHSVTNGHLGCSHFLAIINNIAMNILLYILWCTHACMSVRYMPKVELLDQRVFIYPTLIDNGKRLSKIVVLVCTPISSI